MLQVAAEAGAETNAGSAEVTAEPAAAQAEAEVTVAPADEAGEPRGLGEDIAVVNSLESGDGYRGGRGLITLQGMTGMFLNPTSGTLDQGQLTIQYCLLFNDYSTELVGHGVLADYGVTDWLNVGGFVTVADLAGEEIFPSEPILAGGPFFRVRLVREDDESWVPELSVGGIYLDGPKNGDGPFYKGEGFVAASKGFKVDPDGFVREIRPHLGARYALRDQAPANNPFGDDDTLFVYSGIEVYLPYSISFIGEIASNVAEDADSDMPWAVGFQWKPTGVLGLSVAHMDPGGGPFKESFWFGVGLNFDF